MINQKWSLQLQSNQKSLSKFISHMFSNQCIYQDKKFRKKIEDNKKGYVHIKELIKQSIISKYFEENMIQNYQTKAKMIQEAVKQCKQLILRNGQIRRLVPFDAKLLKEIKPVQIKLKQNEQLQIEQLYQYFGPSCIIIKQEAYGPYQDRYVRIYTSDHQKIRELEQSNKFNITNYESFCQDRERQSRLWQSQQQRTYRNWQLPQPRVNMQHRRQLMKQTYKYRPQKQTKKMENYMKRQKLKQRMKMMQFVDAQQQMSEQMQQEWERDELYYRSRMQFDESLDQINEGSLLTEPNMQFNKLLLDLIKEKDSQ